MKGKKPIFSLVLVATSCAMFVAFHHKHEPPTNRPALDGVVTSQLLTPAPSPVEISVTGEVSGSTNTIRAAVSAEKTNLGLLAATNPKSKLIHPPKAAPQDLVARAALSLVGMDTDAEAYWARAINDPTLPAEERKDLIEDLNEDGLSNPKHPGPEDMPLILGRIQLIEQMAPAAMDQVNADAFQEAYKDLINLASGGTAQ